MNKPNFFIRRTPYNQSITIDFGIIFPDGTLHRALPVEMKAYPPSVLSHEQQGPMLEIEGRDEGAALQSLMDELWQLGVRPKDIGTAGHLSATQSHLKDMRSLVSKFAGVELP